MNIRRHTSLISAIGLAVVLTPSAHASIFNITFDAGDPIGGLAVNAVLGSQYAATTGATFSANAFTGAGGPTGSWGTNTDMHIVSSTGTDVGGLGTPSLVSGNLLRSFNGWLNENGDPSFLISFATPVSTLSATFAGVATPTSSRIFAYNGGTLLTSSAVTATTGQQVVTVSSATPITSVRITPGDFFDWVGVDNISFNTIGSTAAVPEPGSMAMALAGGLSGVGMLVRRRQRRK